MTVKRSLGRGLNELLSNVSLPGLTLAAAAPTEQQRYLPLDVLQPGQYQPRKEFHAEALQELAASIKTQGVLQPLLVRELSKNRYEIIAGERRWRAAQLANLERVPVFIREISDQAAIAMGLIENIQREDLNAIDQAMALQRLGNEFNLTHEDIAQAVGKSRASISNLLRLLHLESRVKTFLETGEIEMGHARAILALPTEQQLPAANKIREKKLSVRATEELIRNWEKSPTTKTPLKKADPDLMRLQEKLSDALNTAVTIQCRAKGKGKLVIDYFSLEELEGILERILQRKH